MDALAAASGGAPPASAGEPEAPKQKCGKATCKFQALASMIQCDVCESSWHVICSAPKHGWTPGAQTLFVCRNCRSDCEQPNGVHGGLAIVRRACMWTEDAQAQNATAHAALSVAALTAEEAGEDLLAGRLISRLCAFDDVKRSRLAAADQLLQVGLHLGGCAEDDDVTSVEEYAQALEDLLADRAHGASEVASSLQGTLGNTHGAVAASRSCARATLPSSNPPPILPPAALSEAAPVLKPRGSLSFPGVFANGPTPNFRSFHH